MERLSSKISQQARIFPLADIAILTVGSILALSLRLSLIPFESGDYFLFFKDWYQAIQAQGFSAIVSLKYDYTPTYLYLLYLVSVLYPKLTPIAALKLPSIAFDFISAYLVYRIVRLRYPTGIAPILAYFIVLFAPTILLNSALWGQSDSIYTVFLLLSIYFFFTEHHNLACLSFGVAFALKLQAIFLAPLLIALAIKDKLAWKRLFLIPLVYLVLMVPAWIAGRSLTDLLQIYLYQTRSYPALTLNAPTLYAWLPETLYDAFVPAGVIWAGAIVYLYMVTISKSRAPLTQGLLLNLGMLSVLLVPFFLPKMHERYFYPADMLSIIYGFFFPYHFFVPIAMILISFFSYQPFLFGRTLLSTEILAGGVLSLLILVARKAIYGLYQ